MWNQYSPWYVKLIVILIGIGLLWGCIYMDGTFNIETHPGLCECKVCSGEEPAPPITKAFEAVGPDGGVTLMIALFAFCSFLWMIFAIVNAVSSGVADGTGGYGPHIIIGLVLTIILVSVHSCSYDKVSENAAANAILNDY